MGSPRTEVLVPAIASVIRWGIVFLLGFATLTFGGMLPWAGAVIVLSALGLALLWVIQAVCAGQLELRPGPLDLPLALFLCLILLQLLLGYPAHLDRLDLGRRLLDAARTNPGGLPFIPGTLDSHATRWSLLFFLAYVICFFLVVHTLERREHLTRLLLFVVGIAGATGIYGLLEHLSGNQGILGWKPAGGGRVRGTFVNADHFAAFLSMALLAGIGVLMGLGRRRGRRKRQEGFLRDDRVEVPRPRESLRRVSGPPQERLFQQVLLLFVLGLVGTALVFTLSRGAILSVLVAGGLVAGMLGVHESLGGRRLLAVAALLVIGGFVLWIGLGPVLDRFGEVSVDWSQRLVLYRQASGIVSDFPVLGTGFGTFGSVFPRYQGPPLGFDVRFMYLHNDLLQLVTEGGIVTLGILGLGLWGLFREVAVVRILGLARPARLAVWRRAGLADSAAAVLVGVMSLHGSRWVQILAGGLGAVFLLAVGSLPDSAPEGMAPTGSGQDAGPATGEGEQRERSARRRDPFNIGITLGGLGAVVAVLIHSAGDFSLRIPANALLLSVLVAVTLQAGRVRFHSFGFEHLSPVVIVPLTGRRRVWVAAVGVAIVGWLSWTVAVAALAESRITSGTALVEVSGQGDQVSPSDRPWTAWTRRSVSARSSLESAIRLDSSNASGYLGLGRVYEGLALRAWNAGLSADGRLLPEPAQRADEARQLLSKALAAFAQAAYLAPMDRRAWGDIGWAHGLLGWMLPDESAEVERQASLVAFRRAMALRPGDPYPFQLQAEFAFQWAQGQRGRAPAERLLASDTVQAGIRATRHLVELQPTVLPDALNRALLFGRDFGVIQTILPPRAPDFLFAARLLEDQGLSDPSRQALEMAVTLALDEDRPVYYQYLAEDAIKRGDFTGAVRHLEFILGLDPQNLDARLMLANALAQQKLDDRALREHQAAVEIARGLSAAAAARSVVGNLAAEPSLPTRLEIVEGALRERGLLPVGRRDPLAKALAALAAFHQRRGASNLAIPLWEQAIARAPRDADLHFGYGESLDAVGAWIPAQGEYRKALELRPGDVRLQVRLADKYARNGLLDQAIALWEEVTRTRPTNTEVRIRLADAYEKLGRHKDAELEYDQVLRLDPDNEAARQALTRLRGRPPGSRSSSS